MKKNIFTVIADAKSFYKTHSHITKQTAFKLLLLSLLSLGLVASFNHIEQTYASDPASTFCSGATGDNGDGTSNLYIANTATVTSTTPDTNNANNSSCAEGIIQKIADLSITKTDGLTNIQVGQPITYTIVVTNAGPTTVSQINIADTIPSQLVSPSYSISSGSYNSTNGNVTGVSLTAGQTVTLTINATVSSTATPGDIINTAVVSNLDTTFTDPTPANNTATDTTTIDPYADLSIVKTLNGQLVSGANSTYTLTVTNNGPSSSGPIITVSDTLPAQLTYVSGTSSDPWSCSATGQVVTCTLNQALPPTGSNTSTITLTVAVA